MGKFKFILISIAFGFCFCTFAFSNDLIKGRWQPDCGNSDPFINIQTAKSVNIEVNTNLLYISAEIKKKQTGEFEILLNDVIENTIADIKLETHK
ncbi:hypothetical protein QNM34_10115 [Rahnella bonaserana]|uniref:hypothetical protein n=1 Tax=Rahnella bonaserana TaxID=2816248 RepID=UPI0024C259F5|nr:hypothetical protein [Rahnella bonaserana]WHZ42587.1 hypothetical protein QNM34_10115 [Rahnella bonaserana]